MNPQTETTNPTQHSPLHPDTHIGTLALTVADLARSIEFYTQVLGFRVLESGQGSATLGAGNKHLLTLNEQPGVKPRSPFTTGLYHFAILVPSRADLGRSLRHLAEAGYPLGGGADHLVSEALYLSDPDNNGIEIYRDRPRDEWGFTKGQVVMASDPLDMAGILDDGDADARPWEGLAEGTKIGHMHMQVGDIPEAERFYCGVLGFDVMARWHGSLFVSAGGYHHHLGLNVWQTQGAGPTPEGRAGLRHFTVRVPDKTELERIASRLESVSLPYEQTGTSLAVLDPWRNRVIFEVAGS